MDYDIHGAELEDVIPACRMMWESYPNHHANDPEDFFEPFQTCDPHWKCEHLRILWKGGRMAATVRVFMRDVYDGSNYLVMGGIGSVATHPDFQKQGLAQLVLQDSIDFMKSQGVDYSSLYAGPVPLYEKLGFEVVPRITYRGKVRGNRSELTDNTNIERAKEIYSGYCTSLPGTFKRSDEYWDMWVKAMRMRNGAIVYSSDANTYVIYSRDQQSGEIIIMDIASRGNIDSLANVFADKLPGENISLWDISTTNPIISALNKVCEVNVSEPIRSFMIKQLSERNLPLMFNETIVDHF